MSNLLSNEESIKQGMYRMDNCPADKELHLAKLGLNVSETFLKIPSTSDWYLWARQKCNWLGEICKTFVDHYH